MLRVQQKWCLVLRDCIIPEKYNISYPETLKQIRRMKMLSPTEEKGKPQKPNKSKPNFPLHVCKKQHIVFNFYIEINRKDDDHF